MGAGHIRGGHSSGDASPNGVGDLDTERAQAQPAVGGARAEGVDACRGAEELDAAE